MSHLPRSVEFDYEQSPRKRGPRVIKADPTWTRTYKRYGALWAVLQELWATRQCLICGRRGCCAHREPEFDLAEIEAAKRRLAA